MPLFSLPAGHSPDPRSGIIPALDVPDIDRIREIVTATTGVRGVVGYKLSQATVLELGLPAAVDALSELTDLPIIYDHQKAGLDVPHNAELFAASLAKTPIAAAIVFPLAGPHTTTRFLGALRTHGITPVVGGLLAVDDYTISQGGWIADTVLHDIARISLASGAADLITPANHDPRPIVELAEQHDIRPRLFVPGITPGGKEFEPFATVADRVEGIYAIVGRAIVAAEDPGVAAAELAESLDAALTTTRSRR